MTSGRKHTRTSLVASLGVAAALLVATLGTGCGPVGNDESAVLLAITASDSTLSVGSISIELTDDFGGMTNANFNDLGNWPANPTVHTVLLRVTTEPGATRHVEIAGYACNTTAGCSIGSPSTVAMGTVANGIDFIGGQVIQDRTLPLN